MDQNVFVLWPDGEDPEWRDTRQGGLFAFLVYRGIIGLDLPKVDVKARLGVPRMPLGAALSSQLWAPPSITGPPGERSVESWSRSLRAVLFLGSSVRSTVHVPDGDPFQVTRGSLTKTGDAMMHVLDYEYGLDGVLLTFSGLPQEPRPRRRRR